MLQVQMLIYLCGLNGNLRWLNVHFNFDLIRSRRARTRCQRLTTKQSLFFFCFHVEHSIVSFLTNRNLFIRHGERYRNYLSLSFFHMYRNIVYVSH